MPAPVPPQFDQVSVLTKANVYFDGKVVSHTVLSPDGAKRTLGLIYPGSYRFNTAAPETMVITDGTCRARLAGREQWTTYGPGEAFEVPADSAFDIAVDGGLCQYVCLFR
jgi:uncharacterized protein YaiE (UPF0345 family)